MSKRAPKEESKPAKKRRATKVRKPTKAQSDKAKKGKGTNEFVRVALDEFNLATFPISVLDKKAQSSRKPRVYQDTIIYNGQPVERTWKVFPHQEKGFPGPIDDDVLMALLELTREQGGAKKVYFSRYDLLKRLGWSINSTYYKRLETSLKKLAAVRVEAVNAFGDREKKRFVNMGLTLIQEWKLNSETRGGERSSYVLWSDRIVDSINQALTRYLDASFYFEELSSATERRLFRYLDNSFDEKRLSLVLLVRDLAHEHIGISRQYKYISQIMQRLEPALDKLVEHGYLESWLQSGENLHVYKRPSFDSRVQLALPFLAALEQITEEDVNDILSLEKLLVDRGVVPPVAARICSDNTEEHRQHIESVIRYFDSEVADGKRFANPGGFLVSLLSKSIAIEQPPKSSSRRSRTAESSTQSNSKSRVPSYEIEYAYQTYLDEIGLSKFNEIDGPERERLLKEKASELLSSGHSRTFKKMPQQAFEEHVRYMVRKDLSSVHADPFDDWVRTWESSV